VPNAIHTDDYDVSDEKIEQLRTDYDLDPSVPTILFVSRLIPEKNPDTLVEAVTEHLGDEDIEVLLVGTGDSEYVRKIQRRADDRVTFLSNLEFEELKAVYHHSALFVFLGTWEGLPTVILEAMNARLPIISTPVGAIADAVDDPENGTLIPRSPDPRTGALAIRQYLNQPDMRRTVGEYNREYVRRNYEWENIAAVILDKYKSVLA
jgi:glycosyltransferase involved in cell wall biosynthesis